MQCSAVKVTQCRASRLAETCRISGGAAAEKFLLTQTEKPQRSISPAHQRRGSSHKSNLFSLWSGPFNRRALLHILAVLWASTSSIQASIMKKKKKNWHRNKYLLKLLHWPPSFKHPVNTGKQNQNRSLWISWKISTSCRWCFHLKKFRKQTRKKVWKG